MPTRPLAEETHFPRRFAALLSLSVRYAWSCFDIKSNTIAIDQISGSFRACNLKPCAFYLSLFLEYFPTEDPDMKTD